MHPFKMIGSRDRTEKTQTNIYAVPQAKNTQMKCTLTGGYIGKKIGTVNPIEQPDPQASLVPVIILTKCPCCSKIASKDTVFMSSTENDTYYHSFAEKSIPGVIKYVPCNKCQKVELNVVK